MIFNATGGNPLNFRITGGTFPPENPRENTIWVNTSSSITGWVFSATEPESPAEGFVWFSMVEISAVSFNALKKNGIRVCPVTAKQYLGGAWTEKSPQIYQGGQWVSWRLSLCDNGKLNSAVTGNWQTAAIVEGSSSFGGHPSVTENSDNITINMTSGGNTSGIAYFSEKIDLTPYSKLVFKGKMYAEWTWASVRIWSNLGSYWADNQAAAYITGSHTGTPSLALDGAAVIDVSVLSGEYYIGFALAGKAGSTYITVKELYLE